MKATPTHERPKVINLTDFNQKHRFQICLLQSFYYLCLSCNRTMLSLSEKNFSDVEPWSGISRNTTVFFTYWRKAFSWFLCRWKVENEP